MGFAASSEPMVWLAYWTGVTVFVLVIVMVAYVAFLRYRLNMNERRINALRDQWRPLLITGMVLAPGELPLVKARDLPVIFSLWSHLFETVKGEAKERLIQLAHNIGIRQTALRLVINGNFKERHMAIVALGLLHERSAWNTIKQFVVKEHSVLSLAAMKALMRIDENEALKILMPLINSRSNWSDAQVANVLCEAKAKTVCSALLDAIAVATENDVPRLVRFLGKLSCDGATIVLRQVMEKYPNETVVSTCLRAFKSPDAIDIVRRHLRHDAWYIRVQAVQTLGKMALEDDKERLIEMLTDNQWWVRYRAAQALASLPFITLDELIRLESGHPDRYARDMVSQVIAEKGF